MVKIFWYDDEKLMDREIDFDKISSWSELRAEAAHLTSFVDQKISRMRFQNRDGSDLEETFDERNFFERATIFTRDILFVDPENKDKTFDFARNVKPELQVQVLEATLSHVRPVTAFMEAIENAMEAIRSIQRELKDSKLGACYSGRVEIILRRSSKEIEIRDNGKGMTDDDLRNAVNYGRLKNRILDTTAERAKMWQSGDFGKYGIGLFTLFRFGRDVKIQIDTKQNHMRERMVSTLIDYQKMRETDQFMIEKISSPLVDRDLFPNPSDHGTRILITHVDDLFWQSCTKDSSSDLKEDILLEISEKYALFAYGMGPLKSALLKSRLKPSIEENIRDLDHGMDALPTIDIIVNGQSVQNVPGNRVIARMKRFAGYEGIDSESDSEDQEVSSYSNAITSGKVGSAALGSSSTSVPTESAAKPCWYTRVDVFNKSRSTVGAVHLLLFFNPVVSGTDMSSVKQERNSSQIMIFWQELFFREELSQFPLLQAAIEKEKQDRKSGIPNDAFDRVSGFMFLDMSFAPDANKTIISKSGDLRLELFDKDSSFCNSREFERLRDEIREQVRHWHSNFDRMDTFTKPYREIKWEDEDVLSWRSLIKRQEKSRSKRLAKAVEEVTYSAKWEVDKVVQEGDYVELVHPTDRRGRLLGQIEYILSERDHGLSPTRGKVVIVRPFEGHEEDHDCAQILRKLESAEWKKELKAIERKLPAFLKVYHQKRVQNDQIKRQEISGDSPFKISIEDLETFQLSVDVMDQDNNLLEDSGLDKHRVLTLGKMKIIFTLHTKDGEAIRDPRSKKAWEDVAVAYEVRRATQFNTASHSRATFTPLTIMLARNLQQSSRVFQIRMSFIYDSPLPGDEHPFRTQLNKLLAKVQLHREFEILPGTASTVSVETVNNPFRIWFGLEVREVSLVIKDSRKNAISCDATRITQSSVHWQAPDGKHFTKMLTLTAADDNLSYKVDPFIVEPGWKLGADSTLRLKFVLQMENGVNLLAKEATVNAYVMCGIPSQIKLVNSGVFDKVFTREQVIECKLQIIDQFQNVFRGNDGQVTLEMSAKPEDWLCGHNDHVSNYPDLIDGNVVVDQKKWFMMVKGKYGMKGSIQLKGMIIEHRDGGFQSSLPPISMPFEIESVCLQFCIPPLVSQNFHIYDLNGIKVIHVEYGKSKANRDALNGISIQALKNGKPYADSRTPSYVKFSCQRCKNTDSNDDANDGPDDDDDGDIGVLGECDHSLLGSSRFFELGGGSFKLPDGLICTRHSLEYTAHLNELESTLRVLVSPGQPHRVVTSALESFEIGVEKEVVFRVVDACGITIRDLSNFRFEIEGQDETGSLEIQAKLVQQTRKGIARFAVTVLGTLPYLASSGLDFKLCIHIKAKSVLQMEMIDDPHMEEITSVTQVEAHVVHGLAKSLRLAVPDQHAQEIHDGYELVSGLKHELLAQAVDCCDNVVASCNRHVKLFLRDGDSEFAYLSELKQGESVIELLPLFTRSKAGQITVEPADRRVKPKLVSRNYQLCIQGGAWPAEIRIISPSTVFDVNTNQNICDNLEEDIEVLKEVTAEILAANGTQYRRRLELELRILDSRLIAQQQDGTYIWRNVAIPKEPGQYVLSVSVVGIPPDGSPAPTKNILITRKLGIPRSIKIISPSMVKATAETAADIRLEVLNGVGISFPHGVLCCESAVVTFGTSGPTSILTAASSPSVADWIYGLKFLEPSGNNATPLEDLSGALTASVACSIHGNICSMPVPLHYVSAAKLRQQTTEIRDQARKLNEQRTALDKSLQSLTQQSHAVAKQLAEINRIENSLQKIPKRPEFEKAIQDARDLQQVLRNKTIYVPSKAKLFLPDLAVNRGFQNFMHDRDNNCLEPWLASALIGVVGEMGYLANTWAAKAVASIAGDRLQTVVVKTERDLDRLWNTQRYQGVKIMALECIRMRFPNLSHQGLIELPRDRIPVGARLVVNLLHLNEGDDLSLRQKVWWRILKDAVAFDSEAAMNDHKARHGRTQVMAAPLPLQGDPRGQWRVERGDISQAGQRAPMYVQMRVLGDPESTKEFAEVATKIAQLSNQLSERDRLEKDLAEKKAHASPVVKDEEIQAIQMEIAQIDEQLARLSSPPGFRGSAEAAGASGRRSGGSRPVDKGSHTADESGARIPGGRDSRGAAGATRALPRHAAVGAMLGKRQEREDGHSGGDGGGIDGGREQSAPRTRSSSRPH